MGRILIVDDSSTVRLKIRKAVEKLGHEAVAVPDGMAALKALQEASFDTVLLDIIMPEMDGFEVLAAMKSAPKTKDIPVIVISALSDTMTSVVKALELGAEDFLPKNFELTLLKSRLTASVEKSLRRLAKSEVAIRAATTDDIPMLLSFINTAGAGLPMEEWRRTCRDGQSPWDRGRELMMVEGRDIHFKNCWIAETPSGGLGALVLYVPPTTSAPGSREMFDFQKPLEELETLASGTTYVSYLCTIDSWRGQGIGSALLRFSESRRGGSDMSIVVASSNNGARALYQRFGFVESIRRPMIMPDGQHTDHDWILMFKK
jgi:CheY-like chemotaxis protein/GNAT superfamily N-acetyltransferase